MSPSTQEAITAVIKKMKDVGDLPVMTATIREITDLEKEETSSAADLANVILKDLALTTKVLKLANSVYYNWSQKEINTISRSVVVLGFKTITNMAVGVRVLDYFYRSPKSKYLRAHLFVTMFAALFSRILAKQLNYADEEEVFILTLLDNIGLLMTAYALPEQFEKIRKIVISGEAGKNTASRRVLGVSFQEINVELTRFWGFPPAIVAKLELLLTGPPAMIVSKNDTLKTIVGCATELFYSLHVLEAFWYSRDIQQVMEKYFPLLGIPVDEGKLLMQTALRDGMEFLDVLQMAFQPGEFQTLVEDFIADFSSRRQEQLGNDAPWWKMSETQRARYRKDSMRDIDNTIREGASLNDTLLMVMEGILKGVGFDRVILFFPENCRKKLKARMGVGIQIPEDLAQIEVPLREDLHDHYNSVMRSGVPAIVDSVKRPPQREKVNWDVFNRLKGTRFCLVPFSFKGRVVGCFYADRVQSKKPFFDKDLKNILQYKALVEAAFQVLHTGK